MQGFCFVHWCFLGPINICWIKSMNALIIDYSPFHSLFSLSLPPTTKAFRFLDRLVLQAQNGTMLKGKTTGFRFLEFLKHNFYVIFHQRDKSSWTPRDGIKSSAKLSVLQFPHLEYGHASNTWNKTGNLLCTGARREQSTSWKETGISGVSESIINDKDIYCRFLLEECLQKETHMAKFFFAHSSPHIFCLPFLVPYISLTGIIFFLLPFFQCKSSYFFHSCRCGAPILNSVIHPGEKYLRMREGEQEEKTWAVLSWDSGRVLEVEDRKIHQKLTLVYFFYHTFIAMYSTLPNY